MRTLSPGHGNPTALDLVGRGVHYAPFLRQGRAVLVAVTATNELVGMKALRRGLDPDAEIAKLEELLDRKDPPLHVV